MIIRRASAADAAALADCIAAAYAPYAHLDLPPVAEGTAEDIAAHHVWVADDADHIVGGVVLMLTGEVAHLVNLAVHPVAGGQGIGAALVATACDAARAAGHDSIALATHSQMTGTQEFYRKLGWTSTGQEGAKAYFVKKI